MKIGEHVVVKYEMNGEIREADVFLSPSSKQIASPARELKTSTCTTAYMHKVYVSGHSKMLRWTVNSKNG